MGMDCGISCGGALRAGLSKIARKGAEAWPARCGGDFRSPRKPAGPAFRQPRTICESRNSRPQKKMKKETVYLKHLK